MANERRDPARGRASVRIAPGKRLGGPRTDPLTGTATRDVLERALRRLAGPSVSADPRPVHAACLLVDVVGLKAANAVEGFSRGDDLLRRAADSLRTIAPTARVIARLGGDELVALFTGPRARDEADAACRLAGGVASPRLRAAWAEVERGVPPAALFDRLYARCRGGA